MGATVSGRGCFAATSCTCLALGLGLLHLALVPEGRHTGLELANGPMNQHYVSYVV